MLGGISSSPFRSLLLFLVVSIQLTLAATVASTEAADLEEREDNGFTVSLKRNPIWERADLSVLENLDAQTNHIKGKYRQNFLAYHNNKGGKSPQMSAKLSIAKLQERALEEEAQTERFLNRRRGTQRLDCRAPVKATLALKPTSGYILWEGTLKIGTPRQNVKVDFDTGSADFVLNIDQFSTKRSSTAKSTGNSFSVYYADGTGETGIVYNETVVIGTAIAKQQAVGVPTWSSFDKSDPGLVGMAFQSISTMNRRPLVQTLYAQKAIPKAMFGVALARDSTRGEMQIGGYHRAKIATGKSLQWEPIDNSGGFWVMNDIDITMASKATTTTAAQTANVTGRSAIMDTGTTLIYGPTADVKALYEGAGISTITYSGTLYGIYKKTPTVTFSIGGKKYPLKDAAATYTTEADGSKYGSIVGSDDLGLAEGQWLIGGPWFSSMYTVFDIDQTRMGFANASY